MSNTKLPTHTISTKKNPRQIFKQNLTSTLFTITYYAEKNCFLSTSLENSKNVHHKYFLTRVNMGWTVLILAFTLFNKQVVWATQFLVN